MNEARTHTHTQRVVVSCFYKNEAECFGKTHERQVAKKKTAGKLGVDETTVND